MTAHWDRYPNFTKEEFDCSETNCNEMRDSFLALLQQLRDELGEPLQITSGYRDPRHSIEASKEAPGVHTRGLACDIACDGQKAFRIVQIAIKLGFTGIGVKQKGHGRFIHLDTYTGSPRPNIWSY
jgi:zinc D-Ala-D-Ala carboxypeptidase